MDSPTQSDFLKLTDALAAFEVDYVIIGGMAMALHGFPRMTKDIDLLLPVDHQNNERLLSALDSITTDREAFGTLSKEWLDKGYSTALEGEMCIDLLYVAASMTYEGLRDHIKKVVFKGRQITTLDVDGMLLTKNTGRESDLSDRLKLGVLKNAQKKNRGADTSIAGEPQEDPQPGR